MKSFLVILFITAVAQASNWSELQSKNIYSHSWTLFLSSSGEERVTGGEEAKPHQFPWQVALDLDNGKGQHFFCGGAVISQNYVLTAAHCVDGVKSAEITFGAHKIKEQEDTQVKMTSESFTIHENWGNILLHDDLALIKLPNPVELNENIQLSKLPARSDEENSFAETMATVSGWGLDSDNAETISEVLHFATAEVISNLKCSLSYPFIIRASHVCVSGAGGKSSCNGDSGGPLVTDINGVTKQIGIVSFGKATGCERGSPHVYTRVTKYLDWIEEHSDVKIDV